MRALFSVVHSPSPDCHTAVFVDSGDDAAPAEAQAATSGQPTTSRDLSSAPAGGSEAPDDGQQDEAAESEAAAVRRSLRQSTAPARWTADVQVSHRLPASQLITAEISIHAVRLAELVTCPNAGQGCLSCRALMLYTYRSCHCRSELGSGSSLLALLCPSAVYLAMAMKWLRTGRCRSSCREATGYKAADPQSPWWPAAAAAVPAQPTRLLRPAHTCQGAQLS